MTAIKQKAVTTAAHAKALGLYLNDDRVLAKDSQNLVDPNRWEQEMARTRKSYGHDAPSRAGAKNTIMYHQILAFNPDESMAGGIVGEKLAMAYVRDYVSTRYPNQEAVWVLHRERCAADGTTRLAAHIAINRTDLSNGRRLNEGRSRKAKVSRANTVRALDEKYGLRQLEKGKRNSRTHARQPTRKERAMEERGVRTDKRYLRQAIRASVREVRETGGDHRIRDLARSLEGRGVKMTRSPSGRGLVFEREKTGLRVSGWKLGRGFSAAGIAAGLGLRAEREMAQEAEQEMGD